MNCAQIRLLLHAEVDNELDVAGSLELETHLKACFDCAAQKESVLNLRNALRKPELRYAAPQALRAQIGQFAGVGKPRASLFQSLVLWKSTALVATALTVIMLFLRPPVSAPEDLLDEVVAAHDRSLLVEHLTDIASSDRHTVKPWFIGKVDFAPEVTDFAAQGFPLVGGRLDYFGRRVVAALVYRRNSHLINTFIWPNANGRSRKPEVAHRRGYSLINFSSNDLQYCLVSDLNEKELDELAGLLAR